jgi:tetratricopeptide (TPR) repeat protein
MRLNLVDSLLEKSQQMHKLGRAGDAEQILRSLGEFRKLPAEVAEMSQAMLGEIYLKRRRFRRARRCLTAALSHRPDCALYHYQIAQAWREDDKGDNERAIEHFERSLELDPEQPVCQGELGLLLIEMGRVEEGLDHLRRAVNCAADDPSLVGRLVTGLRLANRTEEARAMLLAARFRNARDPRFQKLWTDFQFQELRRQQEMAKLQGENGPAEEEPVLLPFVMPAQNADARKRTPVGKIIRQDSPTSPHAPHQPLRQPRQCL